MIPLLTRREARAIDEDAVTRLHVPSLSLMREAGYGAFEMLMRRFGDSLGAVAVVGGPGQNGGDAWVVARLLARVGISPRCVLVGERARVRGDALVTLAELQAAGVQVQDAGDSDLQPLTAALDGASLVVDGLFGTGLDRAVESGFARAIEQINACGAPCLALDLPSGVDADTGAVLGIAVKAAVTVTFAAHKRGLHQHPGAGLAGEVVVASIGVPAPSAGLVQLIESTDIAALLPRRRADSHKGSAGHVLVVAGAAGRTGAAVLAGLGALRAGAGLVTLCPRAGGRSALDAKVLELMTSDLPPEHDAALKAVRTLAADKQSLVLGPGFGTDPEAAALMRALALQFEQTTVLDADALTALGTQVASLAQACGPRILTPHPGEAARLLGSSSARVQADRYAAASELSRASRQVVVLKGARSIVAAPDGAMWVCPLDVPALGVAGTGDVLAGVIAALCVELAPPMAAVAGVYLHALAGSLAARSDRGLLAHEVADALPDALERCRASLSK